MNELIEILRGMADMLDGPQNAGNLVVPSIINRLRDASNAIERLEAENAALRAQQEQPNEPLTLDELREMEGEPVWAECLIQGSLSCWGYRDEDGVCGYCASFSDDDYGGYWLAYRRKPEQEVQGSD